MTRLLLLQRNVFLRGSLRKNASVVSATAPANVKQFCSQNSQGSLSLKERRVGYAPSIPYQNEGHWSTSSLEYHNHISTTNIGKNYSTRNFSSAAAVDDNDDGGPKTTIPFNLADIGEGIKEVELLQWFVQEGDHVKQFDRICEVQSDKATVEITSRYDGIVESLAGGSVGDMVQVGSPLMYIQVEPADAPAGSSTSSSSSASSSASSPPPDSSQESGESSSDSSSSQKKSVLSNQDSSDQQLNIPHVASQFHLDSDTVGGSGKFLATPAVRKLGMEYNLDLSTLVGTGPQGRVLKADVITFLKESGRLKDDASNKAAPSGTTPAPSAATSGAAAGAAPKAKQQIASVLQEDEVVMLKGYNRLMIQTMTASRDIPHMGYQDDFNLTKLSEYRKDLSPKVSMLAFFIKASSLALKEYPIINASWKDIEKGEVTMWASHNIGVAMDTPRGLVVPVIQNCQNKSLVEIQEDLDELKDIAAAGKLGEQHLTGATFSLSNIGSLGGGTYMNPLIVPPQAAIGAMGTIQNLPRFDKEGNVMAAKIMSISWAGDHRMFDGATMARFSNLCKGYLEDPVRMLVAMS